MFIMIFAQSKQDNKGLFFIIAVCSSCSNPVPPQVSSRVSIVLFLFKLRISVQVDSELLVELLVCSLNLILTSVLKCNNRV